jgi:hypothetical protein
MRLNTLFVHVNLPLNHNEARFLRASSCWHEFEQYFPKEPLPFECVLPQFKHLKSFFTNVGSPAQSCTELSGLQIRRITANASGDNTTIGGAV